MKKLLAIVGGLLLAGCVQTVAVEYAHWTEPNGQFYPCPVKLHGNEYVKCSRSGNTVDCGFLKSQSEPTDCPAYDDHKLPASEFMLRYQTDPAFRSRVGTGYVFQTEYERR